MLEGDVVAPVVEILGREFLSGAGLGPSLVSRAAWSQAWDRAKSLIQCALRRLALAPLEPASLLLPSLDSPSHPPQELHHNNSGGLHRIALHSIPPGAG